MRLPLTAFAVFAAASFADGAAFSKDADCENPQTQTAMNVCAQQAFRQADAMLNTEYKRARATMRQLDDAMPTGQKGAAIALRDAQRAWIKFRDLACAAEGWLFRGGSMEPLIVSTCMTSLTEQRTKDLKTLSEGN